VEIAAAEDIRQVVTTVEQRSFSQPQQISQKMNAENKIQDLVVVMTLVDSWKTSPREAQGRNFA
jgi:hypothetical protein